MPYVLTETDEMMCAHGGTATAIAANPRVKLGGAKVLTVATQLAVSGCPNQVGTAKVPCVLGAFTQGATRVKVMGQPVALASSATVNTPTGANVEFTSTQTRVKAL